MQTLGLSTLLFNGFGIVTIVLVAAVAGCLPARRRLHQWVLADTTKPASTPL